MAWARNRTEVLIAAIVVAVLLVGGTVYYFQQRSAQLDRAAAEIQEIQQTLAFTEAGEATNRLREFLAQFGGTPYGIEARLALAEILLDEGDSEEAVAVLSEVAPSFRNPLRVQATELLAVAHEAAEDWEAAAEVHSQILERAELRFQRRDAAQGLARSYLALGDTSAAVDAYRRTISELDEDDDESRNYFEMRLAELTGGAPE